MKKKYVIVGSGLSVAVLAEQLGSQACEVIVLNPGKSLGGIFSGIKVENKMYDVGMTNFEFELFSDQSHDLQDYRAGVKSDIGKFVHFAKEYVGRFVNTHKIPTPKMRFGDRIVGDFILSNKLDVLETLECSDKKQVIVELEAILSKKMPLHASGKENQASELYSAMFEEVSRSNNGDFLHEKIIAPMLRKVLGIQPNELPAIFHRNGWVPLYYPETLYSQFTSKPHVLKPTIFEYPDGSHFGVFVDRLCERIKNLKSVQIINGVEATRIDQADKMIYAGSNAFSYDFLTLEQGIEMLAPEYEFSKLIEKQRKASLALFFVDIERAGIENPFSVITDPSSDSPFYRVTNQTISANAELKMHQLIFECNLEEMPNSAEETRRLFDDALPLFGIDKSAVKAVASRQFKNAIMVPEIEIMKTYNDRYSELVASLKDISLIGRNSGYISATFNDHILQALQLAERFQNLK